MRFWIIVLFVTIVPSLSFAKKDAKKEAQEAVSEKEMGQTRTNTVFGISPPVVDLVCVPGQRVSTVVKIENPASVASRFMMEPLGLVVDDRSGFTYRPIASLPADHLSRHIILEAPEVKIPANSSKNVNIFIDVPNTLTGTQYTGINISNASPGMSEDDKKKEEYKVNVGFGLQPAIAMTIKCHISGTEKQAYSLKKIEIIRPTGNQPPSATADIRNTGNSEIKLNALLILLDSEKKVVTRMKMARTEYLLPGATMKVVFQPSFKDVPNGSYKAIISSVDSDTKLPPLEQAVVVGK
ncbi:MAG: hypothetical protein IPJ69_11760 [Deltaproteobacteria bacterium]|nr:MAG: hypothetical protein IPJ69_11760 [Deltaproteobacteria bacterium]